MNERIRVKLLLPNGAIEGADIAPSSDPPCRIIFSGVSNVDQSFSGKDLFGALIELRKQLEAGGCRLLCAGARRDVYPSGMARAMGGARHAYIHKLGEPAQETVDIFAEAQPEQVGTIDEQEQFRKKWIASLMAKIK